MPTTLADVGRDHSKPVVIDFWAEWCSPCKAYGPIVEAVMEERAEVADLLKVDLVENPDLATECGVSTIPAVVVVREGEVVKRIFGARAAVQLGGAIDRVLASEVPTGE